MGVKPCLRLALINDEDPVRVLRDAGHAEEAELLEQIYGKDPGDRPTAKQRELLEDFAALSVTDRGHIRGLMRSLNKKDAKR